MKNKLHFFLSCLTPSTVTGSGEAVTVLHLPFFPHPLIIQSQQLPLLSLCPHFLQAATHFRGDGKLGVAFLPPQSKQPQREAVVEKEELSCCILDKLKQNK